jgi:hypothetical protein
VEGIGILHQVSSSTRGMEWNSIKSRLVGLDLLSNVRFVLTCPLVGRVVVVIDGSGSQW